MAVGGISAYGVPASRGSAALAGPATKSLASTASTATTGATGKTLSEDQQRVLDKLKARDADVRTHEQAHRSVGGQYASTASFTYQKGPDGTNYAIGGEVQIDTRAIPNDPKATAAKMEQVERAALAPADPSSQDMHVAAEAAQAVAQADANANASATGTTPATAAAQTGKTATTGGATTNSAFTAQQIGSDQSGIAATTAAAAAAQSGGISALGGRLASGIAAYGAAAALGGPAPANGLRAVA